MGIDRITIENVKIVLRNKTIIRCKVLDYFINEDFFKAYKRSGTPDKHTLGLLTITGKEIAIKAGDILYITSRRRNKRFYERIKIKAGLQLDND